MKPKKRYYELDLQLFAEETADAETTNEAAEVTEQPEDEKKYSDKDLDDIVNKRFARWKKDQEKAINEAKEEAAKLAKMNAEQKQQYELEKLQKENAELKQATLRIELGKTATNLLREHDIDATEDMLDFVVGADADTTKANIDKFVKVVEAQVKKAELARATGSTPRTYNNNGNQMSEFDKRIAKYQ